MPVSTAQQLPLFLAWQINKTVLCTNLGNVKSVNPILKLLYCGRLLPVPSSWPLPRGRRHSDSECSNFGADVDRERVAYLRHMSISTTTIQERTLEQCFSNFVRPRPGKFFFIRRRPGPNKFTRKYLSNTFIN